MTTPYVAYTATVGQTDFVVPFPFLSRTHVKVLVNGNPTLPVAWPSAATLRLTASAASNFVEIYRDTPVDGPLVAFQNGAVLTAEDLNTAIRQVLYRQQETSALYERTLEPAKVRLATAGGIPVPPADILDTLAAQLLEDSLSVELREKLADVEDNSALIAAESIARVDADAALAGQISTIATDLGDVEASVTAETLARSSADSALAADITTVTTSVNGLSATVTTMAGSISGLEARYGVQLDVNGYVTGFVQNNNGTTGTFTIVADKFAIVTPGNAPYVPFEVVSGQVRIKSAVIQELSVSKLTVGDLNADINVGAGRIVYDNGTYMKVTGTGFGTSSQFIEWFGPTMDIALCSEANAISYLKINGDAYFGGSLSAGLLINRGQTTLISGTAEIEVGPFSTNGDPKTVIVSFNYTRSYRCDAGTGAIGSGGSTTVVIERSTGAGWTQIGTFTANTTTASVLVDGDPLVKDRVSYGQSGSVTLTDNTAAGTMTLRARITAQSFPTFSGTGITNNQTSQTLGLVSTE